ncbi:MAG: carboxypeptidase-like regulatory domain-containing protein [Myxococcales bacterium]|nr:carboxypeptidase-like regulatory domain-containing protein [Myxococcales bacterium]
MFRRRSVLVGLAALLAWSASGTALANPSPRGHLHGVVTSHDGALLDRVSLTLRSKTEGVIEMCATDRDGVFAFDEIPAGLYSLEASKEGFERMTVAPIVVVEGSTRHEHVSLDASRRPGPAS